MSHLRTAIVLLVCFASLWLAPAQMIAAEEPAPATSTNAPASAGNRFEITSETENSLVFDLNAGTISYTNGVTVRYGDATLTAKRARLDQQTGEVQAEGNVRLQQGGEVWYGEQIEYNFKTRRILATEFRAGQPPFFVKGSALTGDQVNDVYVLADGIVTTDDYEQPGYRIQTKSLTIAPGEYIELRDAVLYLKDVPVFWLPKWRKSLKSHPNFWVFVPGYRSRHGAYLLSTYEWYWNERLRGAVHVDERTRRGLGVGPDITYNIPRFGEGTAKYYYTHDARPGRDERGPVNDHERERAWFTHQGTLRTNFTIKSAVRYQSDPQIVRDFFESEYHENTQPSTYVELNQIWSNWSLNLLTQPRVNDFQETVERLPDLKLTGLRQRLGPTPLFYESESSLGYFRRRFAVVDTNNLFVDPDRFAAMRGDTYHQLLLPWTFFDWLNLTPRAGGRFTYYGESHGPGGNTLEENREVFHTGAEASFKVSRTWAGVRSKFWDLNGVRHIVMPSVNYAYVPNPSVDPSRLPQFDYELPSAELLPIDYPGYNAIDSIGSQNVFRLGLENKLQTKRSDGIENFAHWSLYTDWRLDRQAEEETFSDLYSKLDLRPFSWLTLNSEVNYGINRGRWDQVNHAVTFTPNDVWSWTVGQRYLRTGAFYGTNIGNNLVYSSAYLRFSPNWAARMIHFYDARESFFQSQSYTLYRDLRSWTVALTFRMLHDQGRGTDYGAAITFNSKAFPRYQLDDDVNKPARLLGY